MDETPSPNPSERTIPSAEAGERTIPSGNASERTIPSGNAGERTIPSAKPAEPTVVTGSQTGQVVSSTVLAASLPTEDLSSDELLTKAARVRVGDKLVPMLGGIPLLSRLGRGGMGAVYFGVHPRLEVEVAVKVLPVQLAGAHPDMVERFVREARLAAKVKSPHLVGVIDVNEEQGLHYLVMELVSGVSAAGHLRALLKSGQQGYDELTALHVCIGATEGLAAAHSEGIIHRDIKPDNILLPKAKGSDTLLFQSAKLADLGLARIEESTAGLTMVQSVMGTPGYMAPEQIDDAKSAGKPADVFSMGATLYALLAGRPPFAGATAMSILMATSREPHRSLAEARSGVSPRTVELVDRCLVKDPAKRIPDAAALLAELKAARAVIDPAGAAMDAPTLALSQLRPAPLPRWKWWLRCGAIAAALAALVAGGVWFWLSQQKNQEGHYAAEHAAEDQLRKDAEEKAKLADEERRKAEAKSAQSEAKEKKAEDALKKEQNSRQTQDYFAQLDKEQAAARAKAEAEAVDAAAKATAAAAQRAEESRGAAQNEKKAHDESERLNQLLHTAQDAEKKAALDAVRREDDWGLAKKAAKLAADEAALRPHAPGLAQKAKNAQEAVKQAEQDMHKAREDHRASKAEVKKADENAQNAAAVLQKATEARTKAEDLANSSAKEAARLSSEAAHAAASKAAPGVADISGPYKAADGPCKVRTIEAVALHDAARGKDLSLLIYAPQVVAPHPVILFSHGAGESKDDYAALGQFWASYGYLSIHPAYSDSAGDTKYNDPKLWEDRVRDVALVLESLAQLHQKAPALMGSPDAKHVGVGGHAFGAYTAQLLGGATIHIPNGEKGKSFLDKRVQALLLLAPPGHGVYGLNDGSWDKLGCPLLAVTGTRDRVPLHGPEWRYESFRLSPPGDKFMMVIEDAHFGLGLISSPNPAFEAHAGPVDPEQRAWIKSLSLAFWDACLKGDEKAKAYLKSDALPAFSKRKVSILRR